MKCALRCLSSCSVPISDMASVLSARPEEQYDRRRSRARFLRGSSAPFCRTINKWATMLIDIRDRVSYL